MRVGTPPQWVDLFVSTVSQETWVVGPGGCDGTSKCRTERGGLFFSNESTTWQSLGFYALGLDPQLGLGGYGAYGFDSLALSDQISVPAQTVAVLNTTDYWLGFLGLGVKPTNFTTNVDKLTFLSSMVENQSLIPSHSYGYTAGAHYRLKSVPASLTLGGYDTQRFEPHDRSFKLDPNQNPVVALNEISVQAAPLPSSNVSTGWADSSKALLGPSDSADLYTIDSSTPYLWFPGEICEQFEKALGLVYDEGLNLYGFGNNTIQHQILNDWNLTFKFAIADSPGSSDAVSLLLPYNAFDLQLSYPFPDLNATERSAPINYFPLRKAANSTQYTIGRAFLQETYLIVDYERNNFSMHQAVFRTDALTNQNLVDVTRPDNSIFTGPDVSAPVRKGVTIGIAVGAIFMSLCMALAATSYCQLRRRRTPSNGNRTSPAVYRGKYWELIYCLRRCLYGPSTLELPPEINGSIDHPKEASTEGQIVEMPSGSITELGGDPVETSCQDAKLKLAQYSVYAVDHDPAKPVELDVKCDKLEREVTFADQASVSTSSSSLQPAVYVTDQSGGTDALNGEGLSNTASQLSSSASISPVTTRFGHGCDTG